MPCRGETRERVRPHAVQPHSTINDVGAPTSWRDERITWWRRLPDDTGKRDPAPASRLLPTSRGRVSSLRSGRHPGDLNSPDDDIPGGLRTRYASPPEAADPPAHSP